MISGANLVRFVALILNLSPGTHSITEIGISSPILPENFLSCDKSNVFDGGRGIATLLNMLIIFVFYNPNCFLNASIAAFIGPERFFITCDPNKEYIIPCIINLSVGFVGSNPSCLNIVPI